MSKINNRTVTNVQWNGYSSFIFNWHGEDEMKKFSEIKCPVKLSFTIYISSFFSNPITISRLQYIGANYRVSCFIFIRGDHLTHANFCISNSFVLEMEVKYLSLVQNFHILLKIHLRYRYRHFLIWVFLKYIPNASKCTGSCKYFK